MLSQGKPREKLSLPPFNPQDLRIQFNQKRELRVSLQTGILSEATNLAQTLKYESEILFHRIRSIIRGITIDLIKKRLKVRLIKATLNPNSISQIQIADDQSLEFNFIQEWISTMDHSDILTTLDEYEITYTPREYSKKQIRQCRQNLFSDLNKGYDLSKIAKEVSVTCIENFLLNASYDEFYQFVCEYNLKYSLYAFRKSDPGSVVQSVINQLELCYSLPEIALDIGLNRAKLKGSAVFYMGNHIEYDQNIASIS